MLVRYGWAGSVVTVVVGLLVWFLIAPLCSPPLLATIVMVIGIIITVVGLVSLVAYFLAPRTRP